MSALANRHFVKMNGIGNEIIVLDLRGAGVMARPEDARAIARAPRLAYDQLMVLSEPRTAGTDAFMTIYNNDGLLSGACGNGTRCVAWALARSDGLKTARLETAAGVVETSRAGETRFTVDMGAPRLGWRDIPLSRQAEDTRAVRLAAADAAGLGAFCAVNMGNPHAVFFVADALAADLPRIGPVLEHDPMFPERANVSIAQILDAGPQNARIRLRVWERGAGITRACGSAACATLVAAARTGRTGRAADVELPGGALSIAWRETDDHVLMTGDVEFEFEGRFDPTIFEGAPA